ncbi:MAG: glycosyltransferase family 4 protein, partial [Rhodospirillaceae bacterium]|nr:glycosyltransferase family 4 protein [Rhodospirillaceae bacterium]
FTGFRNQTELPGVYRAAAIFVLASEKEPWGLGINEAMASGTSVIASDQCGAAFDLINEKTGLLVRSGDVAGLADALVESLEHSDEKGRAAKDRIAKWDFSADIKGLKSALEYLAGVAK